MDKIRIYTDESVNIAVVEGLKRRGIDAFSARDMGNLGLTDQEQLIFANNQEAVVFSHDTDFLQIAAKWIKEKRAHHGIIYCHQKDYTLGECIRRLKLLATILTRDDIINHVEFL
jgi:predicted nuclease of predicted toxin-antitoxin system